MVGAPANQWGYTPTQYKYGLATAPLAGQVIASLQVAQDGLWLVKLLPSYGPTADVIDNMAVVVNNVPLGPLTVLPVANSDPVETVLDVVLMQRGGAISIVAIAAGAVGSIYRAVIRATPIASLSTV